MRFIFLNLILKISSIITNFVLNLKKRIKLSGKTYFRGIPIIDIKKGAKLIIGNNVTLNSSNYKYHLNMYNRVKLLADNDKAIIRIGNNTRIHGSCLHAYKKIEIGENCLIAANCQIFDNNGHELSLDNVSNRINSSANTSKSKQVIIKDNVWIGANSIILPGTTIEEGSIIAAGSVITKNVPSYCLVGGNPASIIKKYSN